MASDVIVGAGAKCFQLACKALIGTDDCGSQFRRVQIRNVGKDGQTNVTSCGSKADIASPFKQPRKPSRVIGNILFDGGRSNPIGSRNVSRTEPAFGAVVGGEVTFKT